MKLGVSCSKNIFALLKAVSMKSPRQKDACLLFVPTTDLRGDLTAIIISYWLSSSDLASNYSSCKEASVLHWEWKLYPHYRLRKIATFLFLLSHSPCKSMPRAVFSTKLLFTLLVHASYSKLP